LPLLIKGILTSEDAVRACATGIDGIVVSNHGGRTVDTVPATPKALGEVVDTLGGRMPVPVDGGIRRGIDVLKMLAIGATAVMVGRPYLYGLCVDGSEGVRRVIELLRGELMSAMAFVGHPDVPSLNRNLLWSSSPYRGSLKTRGTSAAPLSHHRFLTVGKPIGAQSSYD
jgi:4-hydroxymandelate oxidase